MHGGLLYLAFCLSVTRQELRLDNMSLDHISDHYGNRQLQLWSEIMSLAGVLYSTSSCIFYVSLRIVVEVTKEGM